MLRAFPPSAPRARLPPDCLSTSLVQKQEPPKLTARQEQTQLPTTTVTEVTESAATKVGKFYAVVATFPTDKSHSCAFRRNEHFKTFLRDFILHAVPVQDAYFTMMRADVTNSVLTWLPLEEQKRAWVVEEKHITHSLFQGTTLFQAIDAEAATKRDKLVDKVLQSKKEPSSGDLQALAHLVFAPLEAQLVVEAVKKTYKGSSSGRAQVFSDVLARVSNVVFKHMYVIEYARSLGCEPSLPRNSDPNSYDYLKNPGTPLDCHGRSYDEAQAAIEADTLLEHYPQYYGLSPYVNNFKPALVLNRKTDRALRDYEAPLWDLTSVLYAFYFPVAPDGKLGEYFNAAQKTQRNPFFVDGSGQVGVTFPPNLSALTLIPAYRTKFFASVGASVISTMQGARAYAAGDFANLKGRTSGGLPADISAELARKYCAESFPLVK